MLYNNVIWFYCYRWLAICFAVPYVVGYLTLWGLPLLKCTGSIPILASQLALPILLSKFIALNYLRAGETFGNLSLPTVISVLSAGALLCVYYPLTQLQYLCGMRGIMGLDMSLVMSAVFFATLLCTDVLCLRYTRSLTRRIFWSFTAINLAITPLVTQLLMTLIVVDQLASINHVRFAGGHAPFTF